jgi:hypothetical protein
MTALDTLQRRVNALSESLAHLGEIPQNRLTAIAHAVSREEGAQR